MEPKIRFKGFEEEWEKVKLGNVCSVNRGTRITKKELNTNHSYPVYQNTNYPLGYYKNYNVEANNPYVIIGGSAGLIGFSNVPFWAADDCAYFGDNDSLDKTFLYSTLLFHIAEIKRNVRGSSVPRLDRSTLIDLEINLPSFSEQQFIATYFRTLDNKIQSTSKKLASLKKLKSASLVAMFPQNGESMPKVRFKGFEGEWSTNNLGSIFAERIESNENGEMLSVTMNNGIIRSSDNGRFDNSNSDKSKYKVVKIGDIAYNSMRMWQGASGVSQYEGIVSPAYTVVTPSVDVDTDFFGYLFKTDDVIRLFKLNSQGLTSDNWNLKYPAFSRICVSYPKSKEEQQAIAAYFRSLDRKIALETARLEKLKQIKLACLDKMFV